MDTRFKNTEYAVEADSYTMQSLWETYSNEQLNLYKTERNTIDWKQDLKGTLTQIGELNGRPIIVCFFWAKLNNHLIVFYEATSQLVDWCMVEEWLDINCPCERCDANNFGNVLHLIKKAGP